MERIATYTANAPITSTQLNDLQDVTVGLVSGSNANVLSAPGCDGCEWQSSAASLSSATQVKVDASRDWRDRVLTVAYYTPLAATTQPGGGNDYLYDYDLTSLRKGYTGRGALDLTNNVPTNGNPPVPAATTSWALQIATDVWLYASTVDGALYLYNDTAGTLKTPILSITATAPTGLRP
jgi:hypothetical protein